jgi:hypothetical protein
MKPRLRKCRGNELLPIKDFFWDKAANTLKAKKPIWIFGWFPGRFLIEGNRETVEFINRETIDVGDGGWVVYRAAKWQDDKYPVVYIPFEHKNG